MNIPEQIKIKGSIICLFFVLIFAGCTEKAALVEVSRLEGNALGTTYHIIYLGEEVDSIQREIDSLHKWFNFELSTYDSSSLISTINKNDSVRFRISGAYHDLYIMVNMSKEINHKTNGAFDPGSASLFKIYNQAKKNGVAMDSNRVNKALNHSGIQKVSIMHGFNYYYLDKSEVDLELNFNAIAKGYFVDLITELLDSSHLKNYMVEVGGEVRTKGTNSEGKSWRIGINIPKVGSPANQFFEVIELTDQSMATSGNYQNYYYVDDVLIGHTIDPRNGRPVISNLKSATIIHKECAVADAYATACMVLGMEDSKIMIEKDSSLSAYFIYEEAGELKGVHIE